MSVKRAIPLAVAEKLLTDAGAPRISLAAKTALKEALEAITQDIAFHAIEFAKHSQRKTILKSDMSLAIKSKKIQ